MISTDLRLFWFLLSCFIHKFCCWSAPHLRLLVSHRQTSRPATKSAHLITNPFVLDIRRATKTRNHLETFASWTNTIANETKVCCDSFIRWNHMMLINNFFVSFFRRFDTTERGRMSRQQISSFAVKRKQHYFRLDWVTKTISFISNISLFFFNYYER